LRDNVPAHLQPLKKEADLLHIRRNFSNHLYKMKAGFKGALSKQVIAKLVADFAAAIRNNIGKTDEMKIIALKNIVDHNFGIHTTCGEWCAAKLDPSHKPKLPYGRYLSDPQLRTALESEMEFFTTTEMIDKLKNGASSQRAELAFSLLGKLAPKDVHTSSSPTLGRRTHLMVAQYNEGVAYSNLIWNKLGVKSSKQRSKIYKKWTQSSNQRGVWKKTEAARIRRKVLKQQRSAKSKTDKASEPISYKSGMGVENIAIEPQRKRRTPEELRDARRFKCNQPGCDKAYVENGGLLQHMRNKHPGNL